MELEEVPVVTVVHVAGVGHDMERCTYPYVFWLIALVIDRRRIPYPFVVHTKPLALGNLGTGLGVGGVCSSVPVAVLALAQWGQRQNGCLEVAAVLQDGIGTKGTVGSPQFKGGCVTRKHVEIRSAGPQGGTPLFPVLPRAPPVVDVSTLVHQRPAVPLEQCLPPVSVRRLVQGVTGSLTVGTETTAPTRRVDLVRPYVGVEGAGEFPQSLSFIRGDDGDILPGATD
jgi:hypothetical protein